MAALRLGKHRCEFEIWHLFVHKDMSFSVTLFYGQGFHLEQLLEGPWDPHTMHIGGPFDTIKGPNCFLYKRLHNVCISFFLFNVTTNNTCHLKMHHCRPFKKKETGLHLKAYLKSTC